MSLTAVQNLAAQIKTTVSVTIEPQVLAMKVGASEQLRAHCRDSAGVETTGKGGAWVGADGRVRGLAAGSTSITATADGASDTMAVEVTAA